MVTKNGIKTTNGEPLEAEADEPISAPVQASQPLEQAAPAIVPAKATQTAEAEITQAIQTLTTLATLKLKTQESQEQSLDVLRKIESLFKIEEPISPQDLEDLKTGFKTLNKFALAVNQYHETKVKAEEAKRVLDEILGSFKPRVS